MTPLRSLLVQSKLKLGWLVFPHLFVFRTRRPIHASVSSSIALYLTCLGCLVSYAYATQLFAHVHTNPRHIPSTHQSGALRDASCALFHRQTPPPFQPITHENRPPTTITHVSHPLVSTYRILNIGSTFH